MRGSVKVLISAGAGLALLTGGGAAGPGSAPIGWTITGESGHSVQADAICAK